VNFITGLRNVARQAMLDGKLSIMDWTCNDVTTFFSFELIEFWSSLVQIAKARQEWEAALRWLEQAARDEPLDKEVHEIHLILQTTPWKAELHILHSCLSFLEMAQTAGCQVARSTWRFHQLQAVSFRYAAVKSNVIISLAAQYYRSS
jgi:hypothetical protein